MRGFVMAALYLVGPVAVAAQQTEEDGYTRYELLAPASSKFRILYEISATAPGATRYFNPIRKGSVATDEHVVDRATGQALQWDVVDGDVARSEGASEADPAGQYIRIALARPVPAGGGEARLLIDKTYQDSKSYFASGDTIVFDRSLGVKRNAVLLPAGYELVSANYPAQILREADGRVLVSFWNVTPAVAPLRLVGRRAATPQAAQTASGDERARQSREIVYTLNDPASHSFLLAHDYTEDRPGTDRYVNVVRTGSTVTAPSARNLDSGESLPATLLTGEEAVRAAPELRGAANPQAVLVRFAPVKPGRSIRLRIAETYTDPGGYRLQGDDLLVWTRTLGRAANAVVLPAGWLLTSSTVPCTVETGADGRIRIDFLNSRPGDLDVRIVAHRG